MIIFGCPFSLRMPRGIQRAYYLWCRYATHTKFTTRKMDCSDLGFSVKITSVPSVLQSLRPTQLPLITPASWVIVFPSTTPSLSLLNTHTHKPHAHKCSHHWITQDSLVLEDTSSCNLNGSKSLFSWIFIPGVTGVGHRGDVMPRLLDHFTALIWGLSYMQSL